MTQTLSHTSWFEESDLAILAAGQESGRLPESLSAVAVALQRESDAETGLWLKLAEPVMIAGIGIVVGILVAAALLPVFEMNKLVR